jgi:preprotein translocase subunit YajC
MDFSLLLPLFLLVLFIPIFLSGRKQRKQMAEMQEMQRALEDGDVVVTTSGLRGVVVDASYEDTVDLEIADGVVTTWVRAAVREKVTTDAGADAPTAGSSAGDDPAEVAQDAPATGAPSLTKDETPRS